MTYLLLNKPTCRKLSLLFCHEKMIVFSLKDFNILPIFSVIIESFEGIEIRYLIHTDHQ